MPNYYEWIELRRRRGRRNRNADRWGAVLAGSLLFALPAASGLYRGFFGWIDLVVGAIGLAGLAVAAEAFMRKAKGVS